MAQPEAWVWDGLVHCAGDCRNMVTATTDCTCKTNFLSAGSGSYLGMSRSMHRNCGLTAAKLLYEVCSPVRHPRQSISVNLYDYPVCESKEIRDQFVCQAAQARLCDEAEKLITRIASNEGVQSELGNICIERLGFAHALLPSDVAADIAGYYLPSIAELTTTRPDLTLIETIKLTYRIKELPRISLESILEQSHRLSPDAIVELVQQPCQLIAAEDNRRIRRPFRRESYSRVGNILEALPVAGWFPRSALYFRTVVAEVNRIRESRTRRLPMPKRTVRNVSMRPVDSGPESGVSSVFGGRRSSAPAIP